MRREMIFSIMHLNLVPDLTLNSARSAHCESISSGKFLISKATLKFIRLYFVDSVCVQAHAKSN